MASNVELFSHIVEKEENKKNFSLFREKIEMENCIFFNRYWGDLGNFL